MEHNLRKKARDLMTRTGYKAGGHLGRAKDEAEDKKMIEKAFKEHDDQLHGGKETRLKLKHGGVADGEKAEARMDRPSREHHAKGGKAGHKKGGTKVNVIVMPQGAHPGMDAPAGSPPPGAMPPRPPMAPPPAMAPHPPMGPPPGGGMPPGAGMPPPGMARPPGMKRGGRTGLADGGMPQVGSDRPLAPLTEQQTNQYKRGGTAKEMTGGAGGGKGRLEKAESLGFKHGRGR